MSNPYGYYSIGFYPKYSSLTEIRHAIDNGGRYDFNKGANYKTYFDLRNPVNKTVREEVMRAFGLDPNLGYDENCHLMHTVDSITLISLIK